MAIQDDSLEDYREAGEEREGEDNYELVEKIFREVVAKPVFFHILFEREIVDGQDATNIYNIVGEALKSVIENQEVSVEMDRMEEFEEYLLELRRHTYNQAIEEILTLVSLASLKNKCQCDQ